MKLTDDDAAGAEPGWRSSPARPRRLRVGEVAALLRQEAEAVARALLPGGRRDGRHWVAASTRRGGPGDSLKVNIAPPYIGRWRHFATSERGDLLDLARRELGDAAGLEWARRRVGDCSPETALAARNAPPAPDTSTADAARDAAEKAQNRAKAVRLWDEGKPLEGTQAAAYLAARVPGAAVLRLLRPDVLRFHPRARDGGSGSHFPAMLGKVTDGPHGGLLAVHRTFLHPDPDRAEKAPGIGSKKGLGSPEAGGIWLTDVRSRVLVGEGIETTLSGLAAMGGGEWGAVVARDTSGLKSLVLRQEVREVWILVDVDKPDGHGRRPGEAAAREAAARWMAEGRKVWLAFPGPAGGPPMDFNDLWRAEGPAAIRAAIEAAEPAPDPMQGERERLLAKLVARMAKGEAAGANLPSNIRQGIESAPLPLPLPLTEAQAKMRAVLQDWMWAAARSVATEPGALPLMAKRAARHDAAILPADDPRREGRAWGGFIRERLRHHKADLAARLEAEGWAKGGALPGPLVLAATVGAGKSHAAALAVVDLIRRAPVPVSVAWLVPHYALADAAAARFRAEGVSVVILRGRDRADEAGRALCERAALQKEVAAQGLSVRANLCKRKGKECPFASSCGYYRQAQDISPGTVIIATHHGLRTGMLPGDVPLAGRVVIVDETPAGVLVDGQRRRGTVASLREGIRSAGQVEGIGIALGDVATLLERPDLGGSEWRTWLSVRGVTLAALEQAADVLRDAARAPVAAPDDEDGAIRLGLRISGARRAAARQWAAVLRAIAHDWRMGRPVLQSLRAWDGSQADLESELEDDEQQAGPGRKWAAYAPVARPPEGVPVMVLDATADDLVARKLLGAAVRVERVEARQHIEVLQISRPSFSKRALGIRKERVEGVLQEVLSDEESAVTRRAEALQYVQHLAEKHGPGAVAVVTYKALAEAWAEEAKRLGFVLGHFGAMRGRNDMEDCRVLLMVGRWQPSRAAMEADARTLFADDPEPLVGLLPPGAKDKETAWPETVRPLATDPPDPRGLGIVTPYHPDPRVDAWFRQKREAEVAQGIGRLRGAQATPDDPKHVYLLADVAAGVPVAGVADLWTELDWIEMQEALEAGPLVLDTQGFAERAPGIIAGKGGRAVGERQQRELAERFTDKAITEAVAIRRPGGGRRFYLKNTSTGKIAGPLHVGGFIPHVGGNALIALGKKEFPADPEALAAAIKRPNVVASVADAVGLLLEAERGMEHANQGQAVEVSDAMIAAMDAHGAAIAALRSLVAELQAAPRPVSDEFLADWMKRWEEAEEAFDAADVAMVVLMGPEEARECRTERARVWVANGDLLESITRTACARMWIEIFSPCCIEAEGRWRVTYPAGADQAQWRNSMVRFGEAWMRRPDLFTPEMRATPAGRYMAWVETVCRMTLAEREAELKRCGIVLAHA